VEAERHRHPAALEGVRRRSRAIDAGTGPQEHGAVIGECDAARRKREQLGR
jgi:hypothetical protein